jgi:phage baseplate assembly protein W
MDYLALPFVLREGYLDRATLHESIAFSIGLILSTRVGTMPFAPDYGCEIWDREYSDLFTANKGDVRANLRNAIDHFDKRLYNVSVSFAGAAETGPHSLGMTVKVSGNYLEDGEEKKFEASYRLG